MSLSPAEYEKNFIDTIKDKTGKTLKEWMEIIKSTNLDKQNQIIKTIKANYSLNHAQSRLLTEIFLNDGKPVHGDFSSLFDALFSGKEKIKPVYDKLLDQIAKQMSDYKIVPRKTYVQLDSTRTFAVIKINKTNVRLGLDLGEYPTDDYIQKAKSLGAMPRFSHMIEFISPDQVNNDLIKYIQISKERVS